MTANRRLRIAYLCDFSPMDGFSYSGGNARIHEALCRHGDVTVLSPTWYLAEPVRRAILHMPASLSLRLRWRAHYALAGVIARGLRKDLVRGGYDVVFGAYSLQSLYKLKVPRDMVSVFTSDAVQSAYRDSEVGATFQRVYGPGRYLDDWVERCESRTLSGLDMMLWPSDWINDAVARRYGIDADRMQVVPWGANLDHVPDPGPKTLSPGGPHPP